MSSIPELFLLKKHPACLLVSLSPPSRLSLSLSPSFPPLCSSLTSQNSPVKGLVIYTPPPCHVFPTPPLLISVTFTCSSLEPVHSDSAASSPGCCQADRERRCPEMFLQRWAGKRREKELKRTHE